MRYQRQHDLSSGLLNLSTPASKIGVVAGAIAVIGLCGFFIWRGLIRQQPVEPAPILATVMECEKCQNVKEIPNDELKAMGKDVAMAMMQGGMDCPKCGGVKSMKFTIECPDPACRFHFLEKSARSETGSIVCPKCHQDYTQSVIKYMSK